MKEMFKCIQCGINKDTAYKIIEIEVNNDFIFNYTCENGHNTYITFDEEKFEILFDSAVMAFIDGYYTECISTLASSLERFYEFFIQIILIKHKINFEEIEDAWKDIKNQSERQYGAFIFLYFLDKKNKAPLLDEEIPILEGKSKKNTRKWKEFRNDVIHKGYMPKKEESYEYIKLVYSYIQEMLSDILINYKTEVSKIILNNRKKREPDNKEIKHTILASFDRVISISSFNKEKTFEIAYKNLEFKMNTIKKTNLRFELLNERVKE